MQRQDCGAGDNNGKASHLTCVLYAKATGHDEEPSHGDRHEQSAHAAARDSRQTLQRSTGADSRLYHARRDVARLRSAEQTSETPKSEVVVSFANRMAALAIAEGA